MCLRRIHVNSYDVFFTMVHLRNPIYLIVIINIYIDLPFYIYIVKNIYKF